MITNNNTIQACSISYIKNIMIISIQISITSNTILTPPIIICANISKISKENFIGIVSNKSIIIDTYISRINININTSTIIHIFNITTIIAVIISPTCSNNSIIEEVWTIYRKLIISVNTSTPSIIRTKIISRSCIWSDVIINECRICHWQSFTWIENTCSLSIRMGIIIIISPCIRSDFVTIKTRINQVKIITRIINSTTITISIIRLITRTRFWINCIIIKFRIIYTKIKTCIVNSTAICKRILSPIIVISSSVSSVICKFWIIYLKVVSSIINSTTISISWWWCGCINSRCIIVFKDTVSYSCFTCGYVKRSTISIVYITIYKCYIFKSNVRITRNIEHSS